MSNLIKFNLRDGKGVRVLEKYSHYGKVRGFLVAHKCGLPVSQEGFLLTDIHSELGDVINDEDYHVAMCRPDAPIGKGTGLPRGNDLAPEAISSFLSETRHICKEAIIIAFKHPSIELLGEYIPRYQTSGAAIALINVGENIIIEYVGLGFDAGDITRGRTVHTSILVPWHQRYSKPYEVLRLARMSNAIHYISDGNYSKCREQRITDLLEDLGEKPYEEVAAAIPSSASKLTPKMFSNIYENCVNKLLYVDTKFLGDRFAIMMNIYGHKIHVFEVYLPQRSYC
jgi:hypothetical protein